LEGWRRGSESTLSCLMGVSEAEPADEILSGAKALRIKRIL